MQKPPRNAKQGWIHGQSLLVGRGSNAGRQGQYVSERGLY